MTRIERKIWSPRHGSFIATGETMGVDISTLEPKAKIPSGRFLKGTIPWSWIAAAAALPSRALLVGLCLWRLAGAMKTDTVSFGNSDLRQLGVDRATKSRALCALERAGLIKIARQPGRFPKVTLLGGSMFRTMGSKSTSLGHRRFEQSGASSGEEHFR